MNWLILTLGTSVDNNVVYSGQDQEITDTSRGVAYKKVLNLMDGLLQI